MAILTMQVFYLKEDHHTTSVTLPKAKNTTEGGSLEQTKLHAGVENSPSLQAAQFQEHLKVDMAYKEAMKYNCTQPAGSEFPC